MRQSAPAPTGLQDARPVTRPRTSAALPAMALPAIVLPAIALLLAACDGEDRDAAVTTRIDTVDGVVQVRHAGAREPAGLEPLLTLGASGAATGAPSPEEFGRIESVVADADGRLFVADGMAMEIRVFDADGRFLRSLGRKGGGPGEMEGIHGATWLGEDTLVVMDYGNARLMRITADGDHVDQWPWLRLTGSTRFLFDGGIREVYARAFRVRPDGDAGAVWARFTPSGPVDTLEVPRADPPPGTSAVCRGAGIGFFDNPYGERLIAVPAPGGERVVAWTSEYRLAFIDADDDTLRTLARDLPPLPLPDSLWVPLEAEHREFRSRWRGADCDGVITRPRHRPVLLDIHFSHAGRMLVEHATPSGAAFDLFDPDGRWLATFPAPPDRDPSVAPFLRDDRLYVATRDSLGVQRVQVFGLSRDAAAPSRRPVAAR